LAVSVTLTGDNNYSGVYTDVDVLGGANYGGGTFTDTNAFASLDPSGTEYFLFGNLNFRSDKVFSGDVTTGTYAVTATGNAGDTLVFDFTYTAGTTGDTFNFFTSGFSPGGPGGDNPARQPDTDGDADWQSAASASGWNSAYADWQASLGSGYVYSNSTTIETGVNGGHPDPDNNITLAITATGPSTQATLTSDYAGEKILLGFAVGSDFINLDGHSTLTDALFNQFFTVTTSTHQSANHNTVTDTVLSLDGNSWSVDLYGVNVAALTTAYNTLHGTSLSTMDYFYDFIVSH
jgi:hypothetical protein